MPDATVVQIVSGVDWPATAAAIAGGVVGLAGITATVLQSRSNAKAARLTARKQAIGEVATAARHLHDAVRLYRSLTAARRTWPAAIATGVEVGGRYLPDDGSRAALIPYLVASVRDVFKLGGLYDQMQISTGERYQQIVTPPLERLTAAATMVHIDASGQLRTAAAKVLSSTSDLADKAQSEGKREYKRAESAFERALRDFQNAG